MPIATSSLSAARCHASRRIERPFWNRRNDGAPAAGREHLRRLTRQALTLEPLLAMRHHRQIYEGERSPHELPLRDVIKRIVNLNRRLGQFWRAARGWAPDDAEQILTPARLDWQVELSRTLRRWGRKPRPEEAEAHLILGWVTLGALVEGSMKLLLSVYVTDYKKDPKAPRDRSGKLKLPDTLALEQLIQFFKKVDLLPDWRGWMQRIQGRRNAIHAFRNRDIGTLTEFRRDIREYLRFLREVNLHLPYPDEGQDPHEYDDVAPDLTATIAKAVGSRR